MYYSLDDLRTGVRNKADQYQTQRITDPELDEYINDALDQAQSIIFPLRENYFIKTELSDIVSGTRTYALPEDARSIIGIDVSTDSGENYYHIEEKDIDRRNASNTLLNNRISVYGYYYDKNDIVFLQEPTYNSTNGLKVIYISQHPELDDSSRYEEAGDVGTRASGLTTIAINTSAFGSLISVGAIVTIVDAQDVSFNGSFRVVGYDSDDDLLTFRQDGEADTSDITKSLTVQVRTGVDMPGGRLVRRYIEAVAVRQILDRDDKDLAGIERRIGFLEKRVKLNLNYRSRGKTKKIRKKSLYNTSILTPYGGGSYGGVR